ncbi:MAG: DNA polymerase I, partial [Clostridia bacterium]|nr:DNA polymerase I [Clostridia bacterium]
TLENVLANAENEKGALRQKLMDNPHSARMSYALGTINTDAPVSISLEDCAFIPASMAGAVPTMNTWELRSLIQRLPKGDAPMPQVEEIKISTIEVSDKAGLDTMMAAVSRADSVAVTLGERLGVAVCAEEQYEISLGGATLFDVGLSAEEVLFALKPVLENEAVSKVLFDSKAMRHFLDGFGIRLNGNVFDAMIADYLLHAIHPADSLKTLCSERGMADGPAALIRLAPAMREEMQKKGMLSLYDDVELPLTGVLFDMEREGIAVDKDMLSDLSEKFALRIAEIEQRIYELAGESFNILSTKQLGGILFDKLGLPPQKKTKSGYSTDSEVLEALEDKHEIVPLVIEYRFLSKLKSTFLDGLVALTRGGRVHTKFNQNVTATGRISSTEPNLQNIPVRTELGREIRRAFTASEGKQLVGADYSQIELRLLAHMSDDNGLISAFNSGADVHTSTAAEVFGVPVSEVTREQRSAAKAVNFGIVYGISDFGLAKNIGVSRKEAGEFIRKYLERYPGVQN